MPNSSASVRTTTLGAAGEAVGVGVDDATGAGDVNLCGADIEHEVSR